MKEKLGKIKLLILGGKATPAPPIGPILGQKGLNIMDFCKKFNKITVDNDNLIPVTLIYYKDNSYDFFIKKPNISYLIKKKFNLNKLDKDKNLTLNFFFLLNLIKEKFDDLNSINLYNCFKILLGNIKSFNFLKYND